ncbi:MAG TPA: 3-isopropylmalate dehydratase small subunit [Vicinamibacterales bacterium]|jgi:3-isopropylmalate/(R)-2-methylmalate dehydratase small subunit
MTETSLAITRISGRGLPLRGHDIDTDRIMPARFLKAVSFEGLERHVFEDDRAADPRHAFNDSKYAGATVLVVNANFGCGSSREHAPQGLFRAGIRAVIGESFSEIFRGNAAVIGLPCVAADARAIDQLQGAIEAAPQTIIDVDLVAGRVRFRDTSFDATLPAPLRDAFVAGQWNPTALLLDRFEEVQAVAARLPYVDAFAKG